MGSSPLSLWSMVCVSPPGANSQGSPQQERAQHPPHLPASPQMAPAEHGMDSRCFCCLGLKAAPWVARDCRVGDPDPVLFWRLWGGFGADTTDRVSCWDLQVPPHVTAGRCCSLQRSRFRVSPPDSCCVTTGRRGAASRPAVGSSVRAPCVTPELPPRGRGARQLPACQHGQP